MDSVFIPTPSPPHQALVSSAHLILPAHSWTFFSLGSNVTSSKRPSWFLPTQNKLLVLLKCPPPPLHGSDVISRYGFVCLWWWWGIFF